MNHWRTDTWTQNGFNTIRYTCTKCGFRFEYFSAPRSRDSVLDRQTEHQKECWEPDPQCTFILNPGALPVLRCMLKAGHPEGPQFDWFTDFNGHVVEKPGMKE